MHEVRRLRKMLGGGMRQAGVVAAAGLVALDTMVDRLADDHANARLLAGALARIPGLVIDLARVQTNIVIFEPRRRGRPTISSRPRGKRACGSCRSAGAVSAR